MRIARWTSDRGRADGFVLGDGEHDVVVPFPEGLRVGDVLERGLAGAARLAARVDAGDPEARALDAVHLLSPLDPPAIRDFVAFEEHVEGISGSVDGRSEVVPEWYDAPTFYFSNPHTVLGPDETVRPPATERLDFELEIAAVVGGPGDGRDLDAAEARERLFGFTVMNDWSARDLQSREMKVRLGPCKGKDFATSLGPWIVTADELEPHRDADGFLRLRAAVEVGGRLVGEDLTSHMGWPFEELLVYASRDARVVPGDVLGSGTVGNGGCLGELWGRRGELMPPPLVAGDVVRMHVEGIGVLEAAVGEPASRRTMPAARRHRRDS